MPEPAERKKELEDVVKSAKENAVKYLESYGSTHNSIPQNGLFQQQLKEISAFLTAARTSLDDILTLREQPHIIRQDDKPTDGKLYLKENELVSNVIYNVQMALLSRSEFDLKYSQSPKLDEFKSKGHHVQADFITAELYVAMGIYIEEAKVLYQQVIDNGKAVFQEISSKYESSKNKELVVPMMRLAYKIGTAYKRLFDIEYHLLKTLPRTMEVEVKGDDTENPIKPTTKPRTMEVEVKEDDAENTIKPTTTEEALPYGHIPKGNKRDSETHPYYREARSWLWRLFDMNQKERLTNHNQLEFSHYQFMLYKEDIAPAQLGIGCVFNVLEGKEMKCISDAPKNYKLSACQDNGLPPKQYASMVARAELIQRL